MAEPKHSAADADDEDAYDEVAQPEVESVLFFLEIPAEPEEAARGLREEYGDAWCVDLVAQLVATTLPLERLFSEPDEDEVAGLYGTGGGGSLPFTRVNG